MRMETFVQKPKPLYTTDEHYGKYSLKIIPKPPKARKSRILATQRYNNINDLNIIDDDFKQKSFY